MDTPQPGPPPTRASLKDPRRSVLEVMRTDFRSSNASVPVKEAATALRLSGVAFLPVTQAQVPVGVMTEHSLAMALAEHAGNLSALKVKDVMEGQGPTIATTASLEDALERLMESSGYLLAVNAKGMLEGIVTLREFEPVLTEFGLTRLVTRLYPFPALAPAEKAREMDPSAEIATSKSQAQPHPWDSPRREHPAPIPLLSPSGIANPMLVARDVMTVDPRTCSPESTVLEAASIFRDDDCGVIPVVEGGKPVGLLTDRDAILALPDREFELARTPVGEIMSKDVVTVEAERALGDVLDRFGEASVRRLLVVDGRGHLVGVISWADLVPHVSERGLGKVVGKILENK